MLLWSKTFFGIWDVTEYLVLNIKQASYAGLPLLYSYFDIRAVSFFHVIIEKPFFGIGNVT